MRFIGLLSLTLFLATQSNAQQTDLSAEYSGESGRLTITRVATEFGKALKGRCTDQILAGVRYEGDTESTSFKNLGQAVTSPGKRVLRIRLSQLPGVKNEDGDTDGRKPILDLQVTTKCRNKGSRANSAAIAAAYVNCGKGNKEVTPARFLTNLRTRVQSAID